MGKQVFSYFLYRSIDGSKLFPSDCINCLPASPLGSHSEPLEEKKHLQLSL